MPVIISGTNGLSGVSTVNLANGSVTQNILANGVAGTGPAFFAYKNAPQSVSDNTVTKITFQVETIDTANCFDTATSRFTPNVAGYYQITTSAVFDYLGAGPKPFVVSIRKNGAIAIDGPSMGSTAIYYPVNQVTGIIYLNGSTDYIESYTIFAAGTTVNVLASTVATFISGYLARAA